MPLFSRKKPAGVEHADVTRVIYVRAAAASVLVALDGYSKLSSPKHTPEQDLQVAEAGGWTAIRLPLRAHPWQLHNLAFWLLDVPGVEGNVLAESGEGPTHRGYRLTRDPRVGDWLCGWDDGGEGWTVNVPNNEIARPEPVPVDSALRAPSGFGAWETVAVRLEDPGQEMNPRLEATVATRKDLARRQRGVPIDITNL